MADKDGLSAMSLADGFVRLNGIVRNDGARGEWAKVGLLARLGNPELELRGAPPMVACTEYGEMGRTVPVVGRMERVLGTRLLSHESLLQVPS